MVELNRKEYFDTYETLSISVAETNSRVSLESPSPQSSTGGRLRSGQTRTTALGQPRAANGFKVDQSVIVCQERMRHLQAGSPSMRKNSKNKSTLCLGRTVMNQLQICLAGGYGFGYPGLLSTPFCMFVKFWPQPVSSWTMVQVSISVKYEKGR